MSCRIRRVPENKTEQLCNNFKAAVLAEDDVSVLDLASRFMGHVAEPSFRGFERAPEFKRIYEVLVGVQSETGHFNASKVITTFKRSPEDQGDGALHATFLVP